MRGSFRRHSGDDALGFGVPEHRLLLPVRLDGQLDRNHCRCSQLGIAAQLAIAARGLFSWLSLVAAYTLVLGAAADYFPKLELSMRLHLLRQLAIIATPILLLAPAPPLRLSARADDAPKTAHEAAVLDRIFANWKARHDRVRTLHFTID
ncbi:MAG TPA: hypothetical protein VG056_04340, partial [Pirellulales bacterium]|nr:hypothetical protein [Pirellulales bacterium]